MILAFCLSALAALFPADLCQKADSLYESDRYQESISYINDYLPLVREADEPETLADLLSTLASAYARLGAYDLALDAQNECLALDRASGDEAAISSSLNNLAGICLSLEKFPEAEKLILEAIRHEEPLGNRQALAVRYGMASDIFAKQGHPKEAMEYAQKAYDLDREDGREEKAAIRLSQLAARHIEANRPDEAWSCLQQAVPVLQQGNHRHSLAICRQQQGVVAAQKGLKSMAANYFRESLRLSQETGDLLTQKNTLRYLIESLKESDPATALDYAKEYARTTDTLFRKETARQVSLLQLQFSQTEKENKIQEQKVRIHNLRVQSVLLSLVILLLAIVMIGMNHGLKRRRQREIAKLRASLLKEKIKATNPSPATTQILEQISEELLPTPPSIQLSAREKEVAQYCCQGLLAKEIAGKMGISTRTVETHKNNIFHKLGINSTAELVKLMGGGWKRV